MIKSLTPSQEYALILLKGTTHLNGWPAAYFAKKMWPDSSMHLKHSNGGNGSQVGKAAWLAGGSYLAKLIKRGWVAHTHDGRNFYITEAGKKALESNSI